GFTGGINWYRNFTRNWQRSKGLDHNVRVPALMIMAENDAVLPPSVADGMEKLVPDLEKYLVRGSGHWTQQERPEEVSAKLTEWRRKRFGGRRSRHSGMVRRTRSGISRFRARCFASPRNDHEEARGNFTMASTNRLAPIPQPPTKPVVGNMLSIDSTAPVQNLARLAKELGPIFWLDMMGAPIVIVSGHDL